MGLGLAALGRPGYINLGHDQDLPPGREVGDLRRRTHELLDLAWQAGVRYLDAARSYGLAEVFLGEWLTPERRSQLTIGSKWGYTYVADWRHDADTHEVKDHSLATFERQWPETLRALGGAPDFYLVHSLTSDSPALEDKDLLNRLRELADTGVRVGLSTSGPRQAETLREALKLDTPFTAVQSTWNVLEPSVGPVLADAHEAGWFVTIKEAVANGRLTSKAERNPLHRLRHPTRRRPGLPSHRSRHRPTLGRHSPQRRHHRRPTRKQPRPRRPRPADRVHPRALRILVRTLSPPVDLARALSASRRGR